METKTIKILRNISRGLKIIFVNFLNLFLNIIPRTNGDSTNITSCMNEFVISTL